MHHVPAKIFPGLVKSARSMAPHATSIQHAKRRLGLGALALAACIIFIGLATARTAKADSFDTLTVTGTIQDGIDNGAFGTSFPGFLSLYGEEFTITDTFDATLGSLGSNSGNHVLSDLPVTAVVTVNGVGFELDVPSNNVNELAVGLGTDGSEGIYALAFDGEPSTSTSRAVINLNNPTNTGFTTLDLSQSFSVSVSDWFENEATARAPDGSTFDGAVDTVTFNAGTAVPEPAAGSILALALAALIGLRSRRVQ